VAQCNIPEGLNLQERCCENGDLTIRNLFSGYRFLVRVSHIEIYNEEIRDLLGKDQTAHLEVKERPDIGVYIRDLSGYVVNNADDMERIMTLGNKNSK